jgi:hypothetical protein
MTKQEKRFGNAMDCLCGNTLTDENLLEDGKCSDGKSRCDSCVLGGACHCEIHTGITSDWIGILKADPEIDTEWLKPDSIHVCLSEYPLVYDDPAIKADKDRELKELAHDVKSITNV